MTKDEALKLALEALKQIDEAMPFPVAKLAQAALREALAEQPAQQEPFAFYFETYSYEGQRSTWFVKTPCDGKLNGKPGLPLYTSLPAQPTWVGLTDERIESVRHMRDVQGYDGNWNYDPYMQGLYNGLEFALSLLEVREPQFKDAPEIWLGDIKVKYKLSSETEAKLKEKNT